MTYRGPANARRRLWDQPDRRQYAILLGQHLRCVRIQAGLSLTQADRRTGINATTIGSYERAERAVSVEVLVRIAAGYGFQPVDLLPGTYGLGDAA